MSVGGAARSKTRSKAWRIACVALGFAALLAGVVLSVQLSEAVGLREHVRQTVPAEWREYLKFGLVLAFLPALAGRPRDWRETALFAAGVALLATWCVTADDLALLAQHAIAPNGVLFVYGAVFLLLGMPALAAVQAWLTRRGIVRVEAADDDPDRYVGAVGGLAAALPGALVAFLLIDLLRISAILPQDLKSLLGWTLMQVFFAGLAAANDAPPESTRHWLTVAAAIGMGMVAAVLVSTAIHGWGAPFAEDDIRLIPYVLLSWLLAFVAGRLARAAAHRLAGRDSPWRPAGQSREESP